MQSVYIGERNRAVPMAAPGEFPALSVGSLEIWPPVVLAPMAGVTNFPFRSLCRSFGAGLYVSEMICARPLADGGKKTLKLAEFGPGESPRSLQVYGSDPRYVGEAVARLVGEGRVDHIDMNFGCPVRKVTRKGGGAAIPLRPRLLAGIVRAAVGSAGRVPVTIKFRIGIDDERHTFMDAGRIAQEEGCAAVGLHARTAAQLYDGEADWEAIGRLKSSLGIPVLGNGDIQEAHDALRMMRQTGCDGVIVGRGCLGRPWLFRDLADVFDGRDPQDPPSFAEILEIMLLHAGRLMDWVGHDSGISAFRRHLTWYTKGFALSSEVRVGMMKARTIDELRVVFEPVDKLQRFPPEAMRARRGKKAGRQVVALPQSVVSADCDPLADEAEAEEILVSGG